MVEMITTVDSQIAILTKEGMGLRYCSYGQYKEVTMEIYGDLLIVWLTQNMAGV
ncbi:unnamed protein product [Brassica oleracea]